MGSAAVVLAIFGVAVGTVFRLRALLPILGFLLLVSIVIALARGFGFLDVALTVVAAQAIAQASYFLGLVIRAFLSAACRIRRIH
jgi:energy-converting hydrogenase Eha subunit C